jgi:hypothetical protein
VLGGGGRQNSKRWHKYITISLKTGACVMLVGVANIRFMEHFLNTNFWCCLLCNMALIFAIDSTKDSIFAIPATKESTFALMIAFYYVSSEGFDSIFTFLIVGCYFVLCCSPQPNTHPC